MKIRLLERTTHVAQPREQVFGFFSNAANLEKVTPPWLKFEILTPQPIAMKQGAIIDYKLRLHGLPVKWVTEITEWQPPQRFVDVQISGPYRLWVHVHIFEELDGGTMMTDRVKYALPGGWFETLVHRFFVQPDLDRIFDYREKLFGEIFGRENESVGND
jgi:hypothetical protein